MTYEVLWSDEALASAERFVGDDRAGVLDVFNRVDELAKQPRPTDAFVWGGRTLRLRVGRYRVLYNVDDERRGVEIIHIGRSG